MSFLSPSTAPALRLRRFLATGAAALVLLLAALAVSPALHHWLHNDTVDDDDDGCAVVLFANGVSLALDQVAITPPAAVWQRAALPAAIEIFLVPARYLRQPERGPPVS